MTDAERLLEAVEKKSEPHLRAIRKRIEDGTATFADTAEYSRILSELLGRELSAVVLGLDDREGTAEALLRESYNDTNEVCAQVQTALDEKKGLHLAPQKVPFPAERVAQFAHSLVDPTVPNEKIQRRAKSGTENISMSFHDDFIEQNAEFRDRAGLKCYVTRTSSGSCCPWCTAVAGKYLMSEQPEGLFGRHDNCDCVIVYDGQVLRGQKGENGRRNKKWVEDKAARIEFAESVPKPTVLSRSEAERLQAELLPRRLTGGENGGIINYRDSGDEFKPVIPEAYDRVKPFDIFGDERDNKVVTAMRYILDQVKDKEPGTECLGLYDYQNINFIDKIISATPGGEVDSITSNTMYISIHNHASGDTFSIGDILKLAIYDEARAIYVVGNNGNCYCLSKSDEYSKSGFMKLLHDRFEHPEKYVYDTELPFIKECEKHGIIYRERIYG